MPTYLPFYVRPNRLSSPASNARSGVTVVGALGDLSRCTTVNALPACTGRTRDSTTTTCSMSGQEAPAPATSAENLVPAGGVRVAKSGLSPDLQWVTDPWDRGVLFSVKVDRVLHDVRSKFQRVQVLETPAMGRMLVLDNALQCAERDEAGYHEFITHAALCRKGAAAGGGKRALIIGGGDGGAARELLRHQDVTTVDLVDIDSEVTFINGWGSYRRAWGDPRMSMDSPQAHRSREISLLMSLAAAHEI